MLSICIPVHNYDITSLLRELGTQAAALKVPYEILVQNDCSTSAIVDDKLLEDNNFLNIHNSGTNLGRHGSRMQLAQRAQQDWLLFLDADVALPTTDFLKNYIVQLNGPNTIIYGGICYEEQKPSADITLRWRYGREREMRSVAQRKNDSTQNVCSASFAITRDLFLQLGQEITQAHYGQDILFSALLNKHGIVIKQIENPILHLGLENNAVYVKKSIEAIHTTSTFTKQERIPADFRPVQRAYLKLMHFKMIGLFMMVMKCAEKGLTRKLESGSGSLIYLDLLKLYAYCKTMRS